MGTRRRPRDPGAHMRRGRRAEGTWRPIVLERKLIGMATVGIQQSAPRRGEEVYTVGFGRCALSAEGIRRRVRQGGPIGSVAPGTFAVQSSVCPGDSGGPVLDQATRTRSSAS